MWLLFIRLRSRVHTSFCITVMAQFGKHADDCTNHPSTIAFCRTQLCKTLMLLLAYWAQNLQDWEKRDGLSSSLPGWENNISEWSRQEHQIEYTAVLFTISRLLMKYPPPTLVWPFVIALIARMQTVHILETWNVAHIVIKKALFPN